MEREIVGKYLLKGNEYSYINRKKDCVFYKIVNILFRDGRKV